MYHDHHDIDPIDDELVIWRYMDLSKFVSLLSTSKLFFARADCLGEPFEGSLSKTTGKLHKAMYNFIRQPESQEEYDKVAGFEPKTVAVSCWHNNEVESDAMWKLYLRSNEGIAIRSTVKRLKESSHMEQRQMFLGEVKYIDYELEQFDVGKKFSRFLHKRKSFRHEREVRGITDIGWRLRAGQDYSEREPTVDAGLSMHVALEILIDKIYVAPTSPPWFKDVVTSVVQKYDLGSKDIETSSMDIRPIF